MGSTEKDERLEELFKAVGGVPGLMAILMALVAIGWRIKVPQIGVDYLERELQRWREEFSQADKDRSALRSQIQGLRVKIAELDRDYLDCLADREKCRRHIRDLTRQVSVLGQEPVGGDEERS